MSTHPPGRPRSLTLKKQQELLAHVARGGTVEEAAKIVGVSLRTVQREAKGNEFFDHDLQLAQHAAPADPEKLMQRAARTHWRAAAWLLERAKPDQYGKRPPNSCSPENVYDIASWLVETALESVPPEHRELLYRRMQAVADKALDLLMPHPQKIRCLTRALANRPMPLSSHEWQKTLPIVGDCDPSKDYAQSIEHWVERQAACTPEAICTTKPGDAAISDAEFARRLTLLKRDEPYRPMELPHEYRDHATPEWKLEQAAPSAEEAADGALWDRGCSALAREWFIGLPAPDDDEADGKNDEVLSSKMHETTKPSATKPNATELPMTESQATEANATNSNDAATDAQTAAGAVNASLHDAAEAAADRETVRSYRELLAAKDERRRRALDAIDAARKEEWLKTAPRWCGARLDHIVEQRRQRRQNGEAA